MRFLRLRAFGSLAIFDWHVAHGDFSALYATVRNCPTAARKPAADTVERVCAAIDMACIWYWKEVLCLQRSAATTCLLRRHGVAAEMVIGAQQLPFKAHAWVEVGGRVVNDKPYTPQMYAVLDRC
jgi:Transglutaminase-like superfamily